MNSDGIWVIEGDNHFSRWVCESGRLDHDQWLLNQISQYIKHGDYVIDGGCYIGDHTIAYSNWVGESGRVVAIDPNCNAVFCCERNVPNSKVIHGFLGDGKKEESSLRFYHENYSASRIIDGNSIKEYTIDRIVRNEMNCRCDFIKLDVEGYEVFALNGAEWTIGNCKPMLLLEVNEAALSEYGLNQENLFDFLRIRKYSWINIGKGKQIDILCQTVC